MGVAVPPSRRIISTLVGDCCTRIFRPDVYKRQIAVSSLTAILSSIDLNVAVLTAAQRTFVGMSKFSLTAIPFFILAGHLAQNGHDEIHQTLGDAALIHDAAGQNKDCLLYTSRCV